MTKSIEALVPVILAKTAEGKIPWKAETESIFVADIANGNVITVSEDSSSSYRLDLRTADGVLLDGISSSMGFNLFEDVRGKIKEIYVIARRQALKIDNALEDFEKILLRM